MAEKQPDGHRPDIDWLRVIAVLLLIPFHAAVAFNLEPIAVILIVKQAEVPALVILEHFLDHWQMPLLFVLAGWSVWFSLAKRDQKVFVKERLSRLGIPLLFGVVALIPIAVYMYQLEVQASPPTFWAVWTGFFTQVGDFTGYDGKWTPGHLWFILYLLIFTMTLFSVFYWYREKRLKKMAEQNETSSKLMPLIIIIVPGLLTFLATLGWGIAMKNMFYYGTLFVLGYILGAHSNLQKIIDRIAPVALILGLVLFIVEILFFPLVYPSYLWSADSLLFSFIFDIGGWLWVIALIGLAHRYIKTGGRLLSYLSESSYPFYVLHWVILSIVAYFIIQLPLLQGVSYLLMVISTFAGTFLAYDILVRRTRITRFLFGMRPAKRPSKKATAVLTSID